MAKKGQKFNRWTPEEKYNIIKPLLNMEKGTYSYSKEIGINSGLLYAWIKKYRENGMKGLENKRKPGNPMCKYFSKKNLTKEEQLEYENMKLRIENEMLKKGFLMKEDGTYVKFMK
ncbi:MAG: transposase [Bacilli bacterium]|nr:transposase [Bacilli bacterium]